MEGCIEQSGEHEYTIRSGISNANKTGGPANAHERGQLAMAHETDAPTTIGASANSASTTETDTNNPLADWNKEEKIELWNCIKAYGSHNIKAYINHLTTKTTDEIRQALDWYKKRALKKHPSPQKKDKSVKNKANIKKISRIPLASWAKMLTDSLEFQELQTETASALRLIAEFETPPPSMTNEISFKTIYNLMANAMEGKSLPEDKTSMFILEKCLTETALSSKEFMRYSTLRNVVENINLKNSKDLSYFSQPALDPEHAAISYLATQRNYNPFNIHDSNLKATKLNTI